MWTERIEPRLGVPEVLVFSSRATVEAKQARTTNRMPEVRAEDIGNSERVPTLRCRFPEEDVQPAPGCGARRCNHHCVRDCQTDPG